jgi:hypothetical protein
LSLENLQCFRCDKYGHVAAECTEFTRAATKAEHESRIAAIVARWPHEIDTLRKRQLISQENQLWYGDKLPAALKPRSKA